MRAGSDNDDSHERDTHSAFPATKEQIDCEVADSEHNSLE